MFLSFRSLIIGALAVVFSSSAHAEKHSVEERSFVFSPYSCQYFREENQNWVRSLVSYATYTTSLGQNQFTSFGKGLITGQQMGEIGFCSQISSMNTDQIQIEVYFVEGKALRFEMSSCLFSGQNVKYHSSTTPALSGDQFHFATHKMIFNHRPIEILNIAAMRSQIDSDAGTLCDRHLEAITGQASAIDGDLSNLTTK